MSTKRLTLPLFVKRSRILHRNKYDYSKTNYTNSKEKITIICPIHGEFQQTPNGHLTGYGCLKCGRVEVGGQFRKPVANFVATANKIHHSKYDYSGVIYTKTSHPVTITCPIHGKFLQAPAYHLLGQGCPRCRISKGETRIESFLTSHRIVYLSQKMFADCRDIRPLKFDFYIPSANLLIEYDGEQHFRRGKMGKHYVSATELREVQRRDSIKTDYAKRRGIRLLRIAYTDFSRIDDILTSHLTNRHCVLCCEYD